MIVLCFGSRADIDFGDNMRPMSSRTRSSSCGGYYVSGYLKVQFIRTGIEDEPAYGVSSVIPDEVRETLLSDIGSERESLVAEFLQCLWRIGPVR